MRAGFDTKGRLRGYSYNVPDWMCPPVLGFYLHLAFIGLFWIFCPIFTIILYFIAMKDGKSFWEVTKENPVSTIVLIIANSLWVYLFSLIWR